MSGPAKYISCSSCIRTALEIQAGETAKKWDDLGNDKPQCKACLDALKKQFHKASHQSKSS